MKDFKQIVKREYLKCVEDPAYFMKKYCVIQHPKVGKMKFDITKKKVKIKMGIEWFKLILRYVNNLKMILKFIMKWDFSLKKGKCT